MESTDLNLRQYLKSIGVDLDEAIITSPTASGGYLKVKLGLVLDNFENKTPETPKKEIVTLKQINILKKKFKGYSYTSAMQDIENSRKCDLIEIFNKLKYDLVKDENKIILTWVLKDLVSIYVFTAKSVESADNPYIKIR